MFFLVVSCLFFLPPIQKKYKNLKQDNRDLEEQASREREDMVDSIRELRQENKLKQLVLGTVQSFFFFFFFFFVLQIYLYILS